MIFIDHLRRVNMARFSYDRGYESLIEAVLIQARIDAKQGDERAQHFVSVVQGAAAAHLVRPVRENVGIRPDQGESALSAPHGGL
jgi:hypothetical protein